MESDVAKSHFFLYDGLPRHLDMSSLLLNGENFRLSQLVDTYTPIKQW
jgi:hypothetical protein